MNTALLKETAAFEFTSVTWREVEFGKCHNYHLGIFLEQKINFEDFGSKIKSIRFLPIIVPDEVKKFYPNEIVHHRSRNQLGLYWQMDYDRIMRSSIPECKIYLADFFLEVLEIAKATKPIRGFDYDGFIAAVKAVLPEWLAQEPEV
jgi:hypothetical protein